MIEISHLSYTYPGADQPVLNDLTFHIRRGEIFGLLGPSGSGKSTTQNILLGGLTGFSGTANVFGTSVREKTADFYQRIGVSFELPALYLRLSARENLDLFAALYDSPTRDPEKLLATMDLTEAADRRVENFSKGMKMRLNLCRALLNEPDLLFMDEPTTGQDPSRTRLVHKLIMDLKRQGKTVFLTTHNMVEAEEICDRVGFLVNGSIAVCGTPAELKRTYGKPQVRVTCRKDNATQSQLFPLAGLAHNAGFQAMLENREILSIHSLEASLEDIFVQVTNNQDADA